MEDTTTRKKKTINRPKKRCLVRWTDELDKQILLTIQWACQESGIKIPWGKVADQMGPEYSEGAIVQHLAKLRQKMIDLNKPVPPPLRRGAVLKEPSSIYAQKGRKIAPPPKPNPQVVSTPSEIYAPRPTKAKSKGKGKKRAMSDETDEDPPIDEELYDTDSEYNSKKKKKPRLDAKARGSNGRMCAKSTAPSVESAATRLVTPSATATTPTVQDENSTGGTVVDSIEEAPVPVAARTRGVRTDYSKLDLEDAEDDDEIYEFEEQDDVTDNKPEVVDNSKEVKPEGSISPRTMVGNNLVTTPMNADPGTHRIFDPSTPGKNTGSYPEWMLPMRDTHIVQSISTPTRHNLMHQYPSTPQSMSVSSSRTTSLGSGLYGIPFPQLQHIHHIPQNTNAYHNPPLSFDSGVHGVGETGAPNELAISHNSNNQAIGFGHSMFHQNNPETLVFPEFNEEFDFGGTGYLNNGTIFDNNIHGLNGTEEYNN